MTRKRIIVTVVVLIALIGLGLFYYQTQTDHENKIKNNLLYYMVKSKTTTPLHLAVNLGEFELTKKLLLRNIIPEVTQNIDAQDGAGSTSLELAAHYTPYGLLEKLYRPDMKIAKLLIGKGANVNINNGGPLRNAIISRKPEMIELLIKHGADVNKQNEDGNTPLHFAMSLGYKNNIDMLLKAGAHEDIKNKEGKTPLDMRNLRE